ncbi:MAG: type II toxin-antitoxin system VapB family antitoxin [Propionibacteriaceae bacterium]|nr:type II toxin-antitoxin system VapB family antitoxin [Propionibacteriaceae bacterium]
MRTTVTLDPSLLEEAQRLTGVCERAQVIRLAVERLVEQEHARRLVLLDGTDPDAQTAPRQRPNR